jgi:hypothetical protein
MRSPRFAVLTAAVAALLIFAGTAQATVTFDYPDFADLSAFTLNGDAATLGNPVQANYGWVLRLTLPEYDSRSSAFLTRGLNLANCLSFSSYFSFQITQPSGDGADGLTFAIQPAGPTALGGYGQDLGYGGLETSLAVEIDTYNNGEMDQDNGNHVGIDLNGNMAAVVQYNVPVSMKNGAVWHAWVDYDGLRKILEVRISESATRPVQAQLSYQVDLVQILGPHLAFVGFTAATGGEYQIHDIISWKFSYLKPGMSTPAVNFPVLDD